MPIYRIFRRVTSILAPNFTTEQLGLDEDALQRQKAQKKKRARKSYTVLAVSTAMLVSWICFGAGVFHILEGTYGPAVFLKQDKYEQFYRFWEINRRRAWTTCSCDVCNCSGTETNVDINDLIDGDGDDDDVTTNPDENPETSSAGRRRRMAPTPGPGWSGAQYHGIQKREEDEITIRNVTLEENMTIPEFRGYLKGLYAPMCRKTDMNHNSSKLMWNFWSSFDYCSTVITTIGYGCMSPSTTLSKYITILYAIPGFVIMISYLGLCGDFLVMMWNKAITKIVPESMKRKRRRDGSRSKKKSPLEAFLILLLCLTMLMIYIVSMAAAMHLSNPKNDSMLKSMYFYIVTMTTIGFGDISIIDVDPKVMVRVAFVYCLGFCLMSGVIDIMVDIMEIMGMKPPPSSESANLNRNRNNEEGRTPGTLDFTARMGNFKRKPR